MWKKRGEMKSMSGIHLVFSVCIVLFSVQVVWAEDSTQNDSEKKHAFSIYMENDSQMLKPNHATDRHYTNGTKIVYVTDPGWQWLSDFSTWHFGDGEGSVDTAAGFFLGQNMYTPDHISKPWRRNADERVFAGWLYTGMFIERGTADMLDHVELNVGVIGPSSKAERAQKCIHNVLNGDEPIGWEDQLGDELAVDLTFMRQQRMSQGIWASSEYENTSGDIIAEYGFTVGSVNRFAQAGVTFRYGFNLQGSFGPDRLVLPAGIAKLKGPDHSGYLFVRASGKAVEHNRFLTGLDHEPLLGEFQVGAVYRRNRVELAYSQTFFTQEFEEQSGVDSIGALTLTCRF